jgi:hypothetical protein
MTNLNGLKESESSIRFIYNGDMIVRGLLNTCHNAYLCIHRDGCRSDADGGPSPEMEACSATSLDVRRAPVSAPNSPSPAIRRSRSPVAGYRTPEIRNDDADGGLSMSTSQLFAQVDRLFDGSESDRELASTLLQANEHKVDHLALSQGTYRQVFLRWLYTDCKKKMSEGFRWRAIEFDF